MPDNSDNLDPKEATEAKLCAYLEGELTPAERIEIEQHLAANPQHRKLLVDLAKTRNWMRSIPRETSPVDLGEVFQGQVERAMLLDDSADRSSGMSINRWPQYVLVAAITVLTLGLGVVLVAILKTPQQSGTGVGTYAIQNKSLPSGAVPSTGPVEDVVAKRTVDPMPSMGVAAPGALAEADHIKPPVRLMVGRDREGVSQVDALKTKLASAGIRLPIDQKTVCFVVSADSPPAAMEHVRVFFDRHQIACDVTPSDRLEVVSQNNGAGVNGTGVNGGGGIAFGNSRNAENRAENRAATPGEQNAPSGTLQNRQQVTQSGQNELLPNTNTAGADASLTEKLSLPGAPTPTGETYYVARGITPLQLELLNASLVSNDLKQSVDRVTLIDGQMNDVAKVVAPAAMPAGTIASGAITKGQTITVTIPQLVGPGIEKVNVVKVAEDGTIPLPMIDALPAAGATVPELQQRIADKYREANLIDAATVTVAVATPPSSQPVVVANAPTTRTADGLKDQVTASKALPLAPPTTHPAVELVDVVVVIQPSRFAAPATAPMK